MNLSSALVCSTRPPVSVYGTGDRGLELSGFSREHGYRRCRLARRLAVLSGLGTQRGFACAAYAYPPSTRNFRRRAGVSLLRLHIAATAGNGMLTVWPSPSPRGLGLGPD